MNATTAGFTGLSLLSILALLGCCVISTQPRVDTSGGQSTPKTPGKGSQFDRDIWQQLATDNPTIRRLYYERKWVFSDDIPVRVVRIQGSTSIVMNGGSRWFRGEQVEDVALSMLPIPSWWEGRVVKLQALSNDCVLAAKTLSDALPSIPTYVTSRPLQVLHVLESSESLCEQSASIEWYWQPIDLGPVSLAALDTSIIPTSENVRQRKDGLSALLESQTLSVSFEVSEPESLPTYSSLMYLGWWSLGKYLGVSYDCLSNRVLLLSEGVRFSYQGLQCEVQTVRGGSVKLAVRRVKPVGLER